MDTWVRHRPHFLCSFWTNFLSISFYTTSNHCHLHLIPWLCLFLIGRAKGRETIQSLSLTMHTLMKRWCLLQHLRHLQAHQRLLRLSNRKWYHQFTTPEACNASYYSFPVGPLVGGILGGLVALAIVGFSLLYCHKKRHALDHTIIDTGLNSMPFSSSNLEWHPPYSSQPYAPVFSPPDTAHCLYPNRSSNIVSWEHNVNVQTISPSSADFLAPSVPPPSATTDFTDQRPSSITSPTKSPDDGMTISQRSGFPQASGTPSNQLTSEQADFVNSLYIRNVPAPVIASIVQRMVAGQEVEEVGEIPTVGGSGIRLGNTTESVAPPSYSVI